MVTVQLVGVLVDFVKASAVVHQQLSGNTVAYWLVLEALQSQQGFGVYFGLAGVEEFLGVEFGSNFDRSSSCSLSASVWERQSGSYSYS